MFLARPGQLRIVQAAKVNNIVDVQQRAFAKKRKGKKNSGSEEYFTEEEVEVEAEVPVVEAVQAKAPEPVKAGWEAANAKQEAVEVSKDLFAAFSVGDIKRVDSTPDHKPPTTEDSIEGRYAGVLFTSASQVDALFTVYEDIVYIEQLLKNSEPFRMFTTNAGVGIKEITLFNKGLQEIGDFHPLTIKFLEVLAENKRLVYIQGIASRYQKLYQQFNKEEKITIISA